MNNSGYLNNINIKSDNINELVSFVKNDKIKQTWMSSDIFQDVKLHIDKKKLSNSNDGIIYLYNFRVRNVLYNINVNGFPSILLGLKRPNYGVPYYEFVGKGGVEVIDKNVFIAGFRELEEETVMDKERIIDKTLSCIVDIDSGIGDNSDVIIRNSVVEGKKAVMYDFYTTLIHIGPWVDFSRAGRFRYDKNEYLFMDYFPVNKVEELLDDSFKKGKKGDYILFKKVLSKFEDGNPYSMDSLISVKKNEIYLGKYKELIFDIENFKKGYYVHVKNEK